MWLSALTPAQAVAVDDLAARAAAADGVDPLNEEARLTRTAPTARHLLHGPDQRPDGYLVHSLEYGTAQLVVDPGARRRGIGSGLVGELARDATVALWAFGDTAAAQGFAAHLGLAPGRGLLVMERDLPAGVPAGRVDPAVTLRSFTPEDAEALLALNAAAFAHHPEQGSLAMDGLAARLAEDWFDPAGLILAEADGELLGFHWTKRQGDLGEVYVLGVHPSAQGRGLGRRLLAAGLDHLSRVGCTRVVLYVDSADGVAVQMYESAGFRVTHRDVLYRPATLELP